jgi:hypothetical protein
MRRIEPDRARAAMVASYQAVTDDVSKLDEEQLARPSRCLGYDDRARLGGLATRLPLLG